MPGKKSKPSKRKASAVRARRSQPKETLTPIRPGMPVWYQPQAVLGSAVRYVSSLSPRFNWVGIYVLKGDTLELGPYIGASTEHTRIRVGVGVCGTAVAQGSDLNVPDV